MVKAGSASNIPEYGIEEDRVLRICTKSKEI